MAILASFKCDLSVLLPVVERYPRPRRTEFNRTVEAATAHFRLSVLLSRIRRKHMRSVCRCADDQVNGLCDSSNTTMNLSFGLQYFPLSRGIRVQNWL
jgi:hypothetical protein